MKKIVIGPNALNIIIGLGLVGAVFFGIRKHNTRKQYIKLAELKDSVKTVMMSREIRSFYLENYLNAELKKIRALSDTSKQKKYYSLCLDEEEKAKQEYERFNSIYVNFKNDYDKKLMEAEFKKYEQAKNAALKQNDKSEKATSDLYTEEDVAEFYEEGREQRSKALASKKQNVH